MDRRHLIKQINQEVFQIVTVPANIKLELTLKNVHLPIKYRYCTFDIYNIENKEKCSVPFHLYLEFRLMRDPETHLLKIKFIIKKKFLTYVSAKMILYTFCSKFEMDMIGVSKLYRGTVNIQGLGYTVSITKINKTRYNLFFRFGFKDKCNYIIPKGIYIENHETAKNKIIMACKDLELLKKVQVQIQCLRKPKAFKLQGIYLNDTFPKVKKFVK